MREQVGRAPKNLKQFCPRYGSVMHPNMQAAEVALAGHVAAAKDSGAEGKSYKRLCIYRCHVCLGWHVGHSRKDALPKMVEPQPAPAVQQTAEEQQRRKAYMANEAVRHFLRAAARYRLLAKSGGPEADYNDSQCRAMLEAAHDFGQPR